MNVAPSAMLGYSEDELPGSRCTKVFTTSTPMVPRFQPSDASYCSSVPTDARFARRKTLSRARRWIFCANMASIMRSFHLGRPEPLEFSRRRPRDLRDRDEAKGVG
jgi:hypothetical protein